MLNQLLEKSLQHDSGHVLEISQNKELALLIELQLAQRLSEEDIDGRTLQSRIFGPSKEIEFEKDGEFFLCTPLDSIGTPVRLPVRDVGFCHFEYPLAFKRLAEINMFRSCCEYMFGGKSVYHIGDLDLSIGRVGWFFVTEADDASLHALTVLESYNKIFITSLDESTKVLCKKRGFTFLPLPNSRTGWRLNLSSYLTRIDGISALELAALTGAPLLLDTHNRTVFLYGIESMRSSENDYKYLHALATIGKNGMGLQAIFAAIDVQGDPSAIVSDVRRRLKETVQKTFSSDSDKAQKCLVELGLITESGAVKKKGSLYKLNLSTEQIILF